MIYDDLGVEPIINAFGTVTILGGSLMSRQVTDAMAEATKKFVNMHELLKVAGEKIAQITRNEAAYITSGAAGGLMLAAAACITGNDMDKVSRIPDTRGIPNEIVIQKCQRLQWDRFLMQAGAKLVEAGESGKTCIEDLERAINRNTVAIMHYAGTLYEKDAISLEKVVEVARHNGIPVIVDAAANLPPVDNLWRYTEKGADLVIFSGGKGLGGPQSTGLILGKKALIDSCRLNGSPNNAIGRVCKVGKEEIMGLLTAIQQYISIDQEKLLLEREKWVSYLVDEIGGQEGVEVNRIYPGRHGQPYPRVRISFRCREQRDRIVRMLKEGKPSIYVAVFSQDERCFCIDPCTLNWEEVLVIACRLKEILSKEVNTK